MTNASAPNSTRPYPEELPGPFAEETGADKILALLLSQSENRQGQLLNSAGAWFQSGAVNRITWVNEHQAHLRLPDPRIPNAAERLANKATLRNLAIACIAYINCKNIVLERQAADAKVNRSRVSKGKQPFDDYYLCRLRTARGLEADESAGMGHGPGHRFDSTPQPRNIADYAHIMENGRIGLDAVKPARRKQHWCSQTESR